MARWWISSGPGIVRNLVTSHPMRTGGRIIGLDYSSSREAAAVLPARRNSSMRATILANKAGGRKP